MDRKEECPLRKLLACELLSLDLGNFFLQFRLEIVRIVLQDSRVHDVFLHAKSDFKFVFVLQLVNLYEILVSRYLHGTMRKRKTKRCFPVVSPCVYQLNLCQYS